MTPSTQVAVLGRLGRDAPPSHRVAEADERPIIRLTAFAALGLYGLLQWGRLMTPAPTWRLLGLLAVAVALAGLAPVLLERERSVAARAGRTDNVTTVGAPLALLAILLVFPLAGVPFGWVTHLRVAVTADGIGQGLSALPGIFVPYSGINEWVRVAILLGAAILLFDAALLLAFAPAALGDVRRAGAALPLIALVVVPTVSVHPHLAYLQGLVLFALLAFFMWGERVPDDRRGGVVLACLAAGIVGMVAAPALDRHIPWINTQNLAGGLTPAHVDRFDWTQRYGPLVWPRTGSGVLDVKVAPNPKGFAGEYWKTENLDTFDGTGWIPGAPAAGGQPALSASTVARWTQTLTVTLRGMQTNQVIASGTALQAPQHLPTLPLPGTSAGTWVSQTTLGPGTTYTVKVYAPNPAPARLAKTGHAYPLEVLRSDLTLTLPAVSPRTTAEDVVFAPFGSRRTAPVALSAPDRGGAVAAIQASPYGPVYARARQLARGARTPYQYVQRVMAFLANGYTYDESPPPTPYPLATFLLTNRIGYCQQFAGSMALLLRMGGVPARVATGFTTGTYDNATKQWVASDVDAHAWVEVWFPHYGWVSFDPTPAAAPARGGRSAINSSGALGGIGGVSKLAGRRPDSASATAGGAVHLSKGGGTSPVVLAMLGVLAMLLVLALVAWSRSALLDADSMLAELERALARSGRPIS
ncbi:MAG: transglutaminase domain-containing protein, partial [Solirubrobacterales bacterium]|nr:transglutaminase domain-containing protein [Solirubrobacterales bacterium]